MSPGYRLPFNAPPHSADRELFDERVLGMEADEAARFWIDQRIRGLQAPRTIPSPELAVRVVGKLPGAIAYVRASYLTPEVKALRIDGRAPGQAGYALS
ncbi:MAG TPA: hypothetical protein VF331_02795 [Polyangiales bacterium]